MPIYEYQCTACGHTLEALQKMSDAALTDCPTCHKAALEKLVSAASFQLKGTGWYATDFKDKKPADVSASTSTVSTASPAAAKPAETKSTDTKE